MAVPSVMSDLSVTAATNSPAGTESPTAGDDFLRAIQAIVRTTNAKGSDIASATTTDIGAATAEFVDVTGTTTITGLGTITAGIRRTVRFTGALILTHNATSLILPGSANITTANGDVAQFRSLGSGNWLCTGYMDKSGYVSIAKLQAQTYTSFTTGGTSTAYTLTPSPALTALVANQRFNVTFNATAGATPTLAISGLTAKNLKYYDSTGTKQAVTSTQIVANLNSDVIYDGTDYVVLNPAGVVSTAATNASYTTGTATNEYLTPAVARARNIVSGTPVATTSGTSQDITGIPSWAKEVDIIFNGVSTTGTSVVMIQIGSGSVDTSGYSSVGTGFGASSTATTDYTTGFGTMDAGNAAYSIQGVMTLKLYGSNIWVVSGNSRRATQSGCTYAGSKTLSGALDRVRITTVGGADTFDTGAFSINYK